MTDFQKILQEHAGPPVNIEGIIRSVGIELDKKADLDTEISGQIELVADGKYKISINKSDHYYRKRFTMAHELGHYLHHSHLISDGVDDNRAYRSVPEGKFYNRNITPYEETEANSFAASILMPKDLVIREWNACRSTEEIAKKFQVSRQAMEIRLKGLRLIQG